MLSKNIIVAFSLTMVGVALALSRGNVVAQSEYKIGVIDTQVAIESYNKPKDEFAEIEAKTEEYQKKIDKRADLNKAEQDRYNAEEDTMPEDELLALKDRILSDADEINLDLQRFQQDIDRKTNRLRSNVFEEVQAAVKAIASEENYHLVLEGRDTFPPNVLYYAVPLDITQKVVDRLNAEYE